MNSFSEILEVLFYCLQAGLQPRCTSWAHKYNIIGPKKNKTQQSFSN